MQLSLILPCYNEEANIERTVRDVAQWFAEDGIEGEIIAVNDGSVDRTALRLEILCRDIPALRVVTHDVNRGYGAAVRSGLDAATKEHMAYMDSDGQFDPRDFRKLIPHLTHFAFVTGRRIQRADSFMRKVNAKLFGFLTFAALGVWVRDVNCAMKIWRTDIWPKIRPVCSTGALINAEIFLRLKEEGIAWEQVPVPHYARKFGTQTGANLAVILRMFRELWQLKRLQWRLRSPALKTA